MSNLMSREDILREKLSYVREGELVLELLKLGEELGYGNCLDLFSFPAQEYVYELISQKANCKIEKLYTYMMNVCYVIELYLRGYYNKEHYMDYEEFLKLVSAGKAREIIDKAHDVFMLHINRLKKIIVKSKKKIPREDVYFRDTRELLKEIDRDLSVCERYPYTSANLPEFYFGRYYGNCGTALITKLNGFLNLEKEVYSLYNELYILSKLEPRYIDKVIGEYIQNVGAHVSFNLFEKVINNYLFATIYSDEPERLKISEVDAGLLIREIKLGTLHSEELTSQLIDKFELSGYRAEYVKEYGEYLQERIVSLKDTNYFGELFVITPPD